MILLLVYGIPLLVFVLPIIAVCLILRTIVRFYLIRSKYAAQDRRDKRID